MTHDVFCVNMCPFSLVFYKSKLVQSYSSYLKMNTLNLIWILFFCTLAASIDYYGTLNQCFDCICDGSTSCAISFDFWTDSNRPGLDYNACMKDEKCARKSMLNYYQKFQQDCNGDGQVNCYDFAKIHMHGGYGHCIKPANKYLQKINGCIASKSLKSK